MNHDLDEQTAVALCIAIDNHIQVMQAWKHKLIAPFMPIRYTHRITPVCNKPTLLTTSHLIDACSQTRNEIIRITAKFVKAKDITEES